MDISIHQLICLRILTGQYLLAINQNIIMNWIHEITNGIIDVYFGRASVYWEGWAIMATSTEVNAPAAIRSCFPQRPSSAGVPITDNWKYTEMTLYIYKNMTWTWLRQAVYIFFHVGNLYSTNCLFHSNRCIILAVKYTVEQVMKTLQNTVIFFYKHSSLFVIFPRSNHITMIGVNFMQL
jgi:hypothetical protein